MFLSRIYLNPQRRGGRFLLGNPQAMHAAVMSSFPPEENAGAPVGRVLWRVDAVPNATSLYVLGPGEPDFRHVAEQAGWEGAGWETKAYAPLLGRIQEGQAWQFRLRANPVKQLFERNGRGRRVPHVTAEQQAQWLLDRAERHGFSVESGGDGRPAIVVSSREHSVFGRKDPERGARPSNVSLAMATFDGILRVGDSWLLRSALTEGIGRAKAYGCGLMTLVPVETAHG